MDSLVAIGSGAALAYGLFAMFCLAYGFGHGDMALVAEYSHALYFESAAMILTLVTVGKYLEAKSKSKTSDALGKLVDLAPKTAVVLRDGVERSIPAEQVVAGDILVIRPGEGIPVDGVVIEGRGYVDQAAITGESIPLKKMWAIRSFPQPSIKTAAFAFAPPRLGRIPPWPRSSAWWMRPAIQRRRLPGWQIRSAAFSCRWLIGISLATAIVWLLVGEDFAFALSNAIAVLVISCPCALGLATPVAIMVGTGKAAEMGILIKSAESLENLHNIDTIVLDKTGTITSGRPAVTDIVLLDDSLSEAAFLAEAAAVEMEASTPWLRPYWSGRVNRGWKFRRRPILPP